MAGNHSGSRDPNGTTSSVDRTLHLLWLGYVVSSALFTGMGYLLIGTASDRFVADALVTGSGNGLIVATVVSLSLSWLAVRVARSAASVEDVRKRLTLSLVALSIAEFIAIGGIVAGVILKSHYPLILLAGFSLALFFRLSSALR